MPTYEKVSQTNPNRNLGAQPTRLSRISAGAQSSPSDGRTSRSSSPSHSSTVSQENPVELCLKIAVKGVAWTLFLWCLGLLALVIHELLHFPLSDSWDWYLIFIPFWAGDLAAIFVQARVLVTACSFRFLPNERLALRRYMQEQTTQAVDMNYLPLVQKVVFTVVISVLALILAVVFQVLVCMKLTGNSSSTMVALFPLMLLEALFLLHFCCMRDHSRVSAAAWTLLLLGTFTLTVKFDQPYIVAEKGKGLPYFVAFAPFWALAILFYYLGVQIHINHHRGGYVLSKRQKQALNLYLLGLTMLTCAEVVLSLNEVGLEPVAPQSVACLLFFLAASSASIALFIIIKRNATRLLLTKGYEEPLPLSKTQRGWVPSGGGTETWLLLGAVEQRVRLRALNGNVVSTSSTQSFEMEGGKHFQRTNSGSYADLYENV